MRILQNLVLAALVAGTPTLALAQATAAAAQSDLKEVTAEGRAQIVGNDETAAKKAAEIDAKRNAVDQVGSEIISRTIVENYDIVKDQIISKAVGFIHSFEILQGGKQGTDYVVQIKARVSASKMADEAKLVYADLDKPRIMVIVPQIKGNDQQQSRNIETKIMGFFREKDFEIVDANTAQSNIQKDELRLLADGDKDAAAKIALRSGAEVVILGDAEIGAPTSVMEALFSASASLSLRAIQASNSKIIAAKTIDEKAVQASPDMAIQAALGKAANAGQKELFTQILKVWSDAALNGQRVELKLANVQNFAQLKKIKMLLQGIKGVTEVQQRTFEKPVAVFDVTFQGTAERLAELVDGKKQEGLGIEVGGVQAGSLTGSVK